MPFKDYKKIIRRKREIEPQEVFLDKLAQKREENVGLSEQRFEVPLSEQKLRLFFVCFLVLVVFFFSKTLKMQTIEGEDYSKMAENNCHKVKLLTPSRGVIYDSSMNQLVSNQLSFDLVANLDCFPETGNEVNISLVSDILEEDVSEIKKKIENSDFSTVLIRENLEHEKLVLLRTKIEELEGFEIKENNVRNYSDSVSFSHILGFTGKMDEESIRELENYSITDYIGKQGLEKFYERELRGKPGRVLVEKDVFGEGLFEMEISEPESGNNLVLWLDSELQKKLEDSLRNSMENVGAKKGAAVIMDPKTGGILSLVSLPSFDNNLFSKGISFEDFKEITEDPNQPLFNRVLGGGYPVGSTIKPLMSVAALEEEVIDPNRNILCEGKIEVPNPYFPDQPSIFLDWSTHGWTNMRKAIAESCNVYFYTIGGGFGDIEGLGVYNIKKYLSLFGWGKLTGIDLPGEAEGRIPDPEWKESYFSDPDQKIWRVGNTYNLSIGQGDIAVSPLQVVAAFSAIANGGTLYQPQLVKKIVKGSDNSLVSEKKPIVLRRDFVDSNNLGVVKEGMREAVLYGSSVALNLLPVDVGSKTGTAQTPIEESYHNWVTVIAPIEDPQLVLTVVIENVEGVQFAALPVARDTLNWYFSK